MTVHATLEQLSSYVDAELRDHERHELERHLDECEDCRRRIAGLRRVVDRLRSLEQQAPPAELGYVVERRAAARGGRGHGDRLEESVRTLLLQPSLMPVFALVVALVIILYLFSFGVARQGAGTTRLIRVVETPAAAPETRVIDGRSFERHGPLWVEAGLDPAAGPEVVLDLGSRSPADRFAEHPALRPYAALGDRVRLRYEERVVEVVFESDAPAP